MKPKWLQRNFSCPDCGYILKEHDQYPRNESPDGYDKGLPYLAFDCPRCSAHYTPDEFYLANQDKYSTKSK